MASTSKPELRIYTELKYFFPDAEHRKIINKNEIDIFITSLNLGIEYDGYYWHREKYDKDKKKYKEINELGIMMINIRESGLNSISNNDIKVSLNEDEYNIVFGLFNNILKIVSLNSYNKLKLKKYIRNRRFVNNNEYLNIVSKLPLPTLETSLLEKNPELAKQWNPIKNGKLKPHMVTPGSGEKVWWKCDNNHEWLSRICSRNKGSNCPICSGQLVHRTTCLSTINPDLSKQWHPIKNGQLTPEDFTSGSGKRVWWLCENGHEWESVIANRNNGDGCPYCYHILMSGENSPHYGKKHSEKSKIKMSIARKGKKTSKKTRIKMSISRSKQVLQYDLKGNFIKKWNSIKEAQDNLNIGHISTVCEGKRKSIGGFKWEYYKNNHE